MKMFISDNASGVHPKIMQAMMDCNTDHAFPYGGDPYTAQAVEMFKSLFGKQTQVAFVLTGTGANVIGISSLLRPFESVVCAKSGHINVDECGALERFSGSKITILTGNQGKLTPDLIASSLSSMGNEHQVQPKVISISQATEMGTLYSIDEIRAIADFSHTHGLLLHMDGARLANASVAPGAEMKEMTVNAGVDLLSFGGTKNGMMMGEAIISFNPELTNHLKFVRKQGMQLASKLRYISAQFIAYLSDGLWKENALHANKMASLLYDAMEKKSGIRLIGKSQANMIFAEIPKAWNKTLLAHSAFYILDEATNLIRLVTSFDTSQEDVMGFVHEIDLLETVADKL
jgi:threonine aldolase